MILPSLYAGVAQLVEHFLAKEDVASSSLVTRFRPLVPRGLQRGTARTAGDPTALITSVREVVAAIDPTVPVTNLSTLDDLIAQKFVTRRLSVLLVSIFSGAALFLSAIGLYGVLAVSLRTRDLGIRIALGARSSDILALVSRQGLHLVGIGVVIGIVSALLLGRLIKNVLYGVSTTDPISLAISVLILGLAAFVPCLLPALRATRINPITALRE